jgi:hypothetical protein
MVFRKSQQEPPIENVARRCGRQHQRPDVLAEQLPRPLRVQLQRLQDGPDGGPDAGRVGPPPWRVALPWRPAREAPRGRPPRRKSTSREGYTLAVTERQVTVRVTPQLLGTGYSKLRLPRAVVRSAPRGPRRRRDLDHARRTRLRVGGGDTGSIEKHASERRGDPAHTEWLQPSGHQI